MSGFIGKKTSIDRTSKIGYEATIYGPTRIGANSFIDDEVTVGYPSRRKIVEMMEKHVDSKIDHIFDELSEGSIIGNQCIIRRGTIIYERVLIDDNCETGHYVLLREDTRIGKRCKIGSYTIIDGFVTIGDDTIIQSNVYIPPWVTIGSRVFIAPRVVFTNDRYPPSNRLIETIVEDDVIIGANSTIVAGIRIGKGAVIAAGSIVTKSIEPYTVVAGVPAKTIMRRDEYEAKKKDYEGALNKFPWR
ncbi:MAG: DapH/DapD/GlmU-related protein [Ignisphaera sp.]